MVAESPSGRRSEEMFEELYVRQNTGIGMAKAVDH
jgi:cation/acetate symporter